MKTYFLNQPPNKFFASLALLLVLLISSCGKNGRVAWVYYDETVCADKWTFTINNERLKENIVEYFKGKGVKVYELEIFTDRQPDSCADCTCKTGRRIKAKVKEGDVDEMKKENFYQ